MADEILSQDSDPNAVEISLNTNEQLQGQLENFKEICIYHEKQRKRDVRKRFCQLGLVARIAEDTTDAELCNLLHNGALIFLFDSVTIDPKKLLQLVERTHAAIDEFQLREPKTHVIVGLAFEILGDNCRLGRLRNNCSVMLASGDVITLTTDSAYEQSGYKEVCFVKNLQYFLKDFKLRDSVMIGKEAKGCVVKKLFGSVVIHISKPGLINSYEYLTLPNQCTVRTKEQTDDMVADDLHMVNELGGQYIVLHQIRSKLFLLTLRRLMARIFGALRLIGSIDFEYVGAKKIELSSLIEHLDKLWIKDYFETAYFVKAHILEFVIPKAKSLRKPIIGSVPIQTCYQFKAFENHPFLWKLDAIFIEKSRLCLKYPLVVTKLLPIKNLRWVEDVKQVPIVNPPRTYESRIHFIVSSISSFGCQAIFVCINCETAKSVLSSLVTCCPIYVIMPWNISDEREVNCMLDLARALNFKRHMHPILYTRHMNPENIRPFDYGINYARGKGYIQKGDFLITVRLVSAGLTTENDEDFIRLRAFLLN